MATNDDSNLEMDAVIRTVSYTPGDDFYQSRFFKTRFTCINPVRLDPVRKSIFKGFGPAPSTDIGQLERLPLEIVSLVCLFLDVSSALRFSQVNRTARSITASIPQYRLLSSHALPHFAVLFQTGLAPHTTISALHAALTRQDCACGKFSGLLFLPTTTRCCFDCLHQSPDMQTLRLNVVAKEIRRQPSLSVQALAQGIPVFFQGGKSSVLRFGPDGEYIVTRQHALRALQQNRVKGAAAIVSSCLGADSVGDTRYRATMFLPFVDVRTGEVQPGLLCKGCGVVEKDVEDMYSRTGYDMDTETFVFPDCFYSRAGFMQHFGGCKTAQSLWASSQGGTVEVDDPWYDDY